MTLQISGFGYDYYVGRDEEGKLFYNIVPTGSKPPSAGYYSKEYIVKMKKVPDLFGNLVLI